MIFQYYNQLCNLSKTAEKFQVGMNYLRDIFILGQVSRVQLPTDILTDIMDNSERLEELVRQRKKLEEGIAGNNVEIAELMEKIRVLEAREAEERARRNQGNPHY